MSAVQCNRHSKRVKSFPPYNYHEPEWDARRALAIVYIDNVLDRTLTDCLNDMIPGDLRARRCGYIIQDNKMAKTWPRRYKSALPVTGPILKVTG